jgi:hypothetical protein
LSLINESKRAVRPLRELIRLAVRQSTPQGFYTIEDVRAISRVSWQA